jgi:predicted Zn-dependent protease
MSPKREVDQARQAVAKQPLNVDALWRLGLALHEAAWRARGEHEYLGEAAAVFRRLIKLQPDEPAHLVNLGAVLSDQGRFRQALRYLRRAEALGCDDRNLKFNLGAALINLGEHKSGVAYLRSASAQRASKRTIEAYFDPQGH